MKDLYEILGISRDASEKEIKTAYRKAALRTHPDRQQGKTDEEKKKAESEFKEISKAYEILSDKEKKMKYDRFGIIDDDINGGHAGGFDPFEQFADFFKGFGGGHTRQYSAEPEPGTNIQMRIILNIEDIYNGCTKKVKYTRNKRCHTCHGEGGEGKEQCKYCGGSGMYTKVERTPFGYNSMSSPCPYCHASGYMVKHICKDCQGTGFEKEEKIITVEFKPGTKNNNGIVFHNEGNESSSKYGKNGHFIAVAQWDFDTDKYYVDDYDVYEKVFIPWNICIAGGKFKFVLPDGSEKNIDIKECTPPGKHLRLKNKGINGKGDYYLIVEYKVPDKLSKKEKDILGKL